MSPATSTYFNDHNLQGMLHLQGAAQPALPCAHPPHRHCPRRSAIQASRRIIRGADVPRNLNTLLSLINFGKDDEPTLAVDKVRYKGEPIVAVVADSQREAFEAVAKVRVDYEPLPAVFDVEEAMKPGAPVVNETYPKNTFTYHDIYDHQKLRFGDVERGFAGRRPHPRAALSDVADRACADRDQRLDRGARHQRPLRRLHLDAGAVLLARHLRQDPRRAVEHASFHRRHGRRRLRRQGRHRDRAARHPRRDADRTAGALHVRPRGGDAVRAAARRRAHLHQGRRDRATAASSRARSAAYFDSGAYTRLSSYAVVKCAAHLPGPYTIPNVYGDVYCVFTNRTPATAMRGFGVTAVDFAIECQMDKLAHLVGMDPMEFRILNAYRDGDMKAHRREAKNTALIECVQVAAEKAKWPHARRLQAHVLAQGRRRRARRACPRRRASGRAVGTSGRRSSAPSYDRPSPPPPSRSAPAATRPDPAAVAPQSPSHGATRFSSVFGARRR